MKLFIEPDKAQWPIIAKRVNRDDTELDRRVSKIMKAVKERGDAALNKIIMEIEGNVPERLKVMPEEFEAAEQSLPEELKKAILNAASRIRAFHERELPGETIWDDGQGIVCRRRFVPIRRVGLYIPGGTAPLFSTVLMLGIPSGIAGCHERIICTPPQKDGSVAPAILYTAMLCGITDVFKVGGAQAIAAMAYGTGTIAKVNKIFGPGNRYVLKAKNLASQEGIAIDMPAGPSEVMIIADDTADVRFVASDLLSQAEHGVDSQVILVCSNLLFANAVQDEIMRQKALLPREKTIDGALKESRMVVIDNLDKQIELADYYAPEHLILAVRDPELAASKVSAAGSIFLGNYSPESAGDYASGTNHILPTMGSAGVWGGLGVENFMHTISSQVISPEGLSIIGRTIISMAEMPGQTPKSEISSKVL